MPFIQITSHLTYSILRINRRLFSTATEIPVLRAYIKLGYGPHSVLRAYIKLGHDPHPADTTCTK
jgi:hypothetical protein